MSDHLPVGRGVSLAGLGIVLAVFAAGGLGGFALGRRTAAAPPASVPAADPRLGPRGGAVSPVPVEVELPPGAFVSMLDAVGATAKQREEITRIVEKRRPQTEALLEQTFPALRAITDSTDREIRAVLTPDQRKRLDSMRLDPDAPPVLIMPGQVAPAPAPGPFGTAVPAPGIVLPRLAPSPGDSAATRRRTAPPQGARTPDARSTPTHAAGSRRWREA